MSRATPEQLNELHWLTVSALIKSLAAGDASAEELAVARAMCRDNGLCGTAQSDKERKAMQRLFALLVDQLTKAMQSPRPSAALVGEVRVFLASNGITKDLEGHTAKTQALEALSDASLPFTNTKH